MLKKKIYKKIFLVGNKSFLQESLFKNLKNKKLVKIKYNKIFKRKIYKDDLIINFSNHINFYNKQYKTEYDRNLSLAKFLKKTHSKFILISTRQVYKPRMNINENSTIKPISIYGKNSLNSEKNCEKVLQSKLLILRLTNIIGYENENKKKPSLMSIIINGYKNDLIEFDNNYYLYKDLLPVNQFVQIFQRIIKFDLNGIYNIGTGKPMKINLFLKKILDKKKINIKIDNKKKVLDNNFSINSKKLFRKIGYTFTYRMLNNEIDNLKKKFK